MTHLSYLDFHLEVGPRQDAGYPVALLNAPTGRAYETMQSPMNDHAANALLEQPLWFEMQPEVFKIVGVDLFNSLFVRSLRRHFSASRLEAWKDSKGLRVRLTILAPELAALPWEYLYDPDQGEFLALSNWVSLVRYMESSEPIAPLQVTPPLKVLGLLASPWDLSPLNAEEERQRLDDATQTLRDKGLLQITWLEGQTWRDLQRALRGGPWHILHYSGHGMFDATTGEASVLLADDRGRAAPLRSSELGRLLGNHRSLRLVFLVACDTARSGERDVFSGMIPSIIRRGVSAGVGMQNPISDQAAAELTRSFYEALADGYPVDAALSEARIAVSIDQPNSAEWGTPVLYMRTPDGVLFVGDLKEALSDRPQEHREPAETSAPATATPLAEANVPMLALRKHLEVQRDEAQRRYETLSKRIEVLAVEIGRELDSERKLVLQERLTELNRERDQLVIDMAHIEQQLAGPSVVTTSGKPDPVAISPTADLSVEDRVSLQRQIAELRKNLRLIEERKSEFVQETDIPLQLVRDERRLRERIADIEAHLSAY